MRASSVVNCQSALIKYTIRLPANRILQKRINHLLTRPAGRPPVRDAFEQERRETCVHMTERSPLSVIFSRCQARRLYFTNLDNFSLPRERFGANNWSQ